MNTDSYAALSLVSAAISLVSGQQTSNKAMGTGESLPVKYALDAGCFRLSGQVFAIPANEDHNRICQS